MIPLVLIVLCLNLFNSGSTQLADSNANVTQDINVTQITQSLPTESQTESQTEGQTESQTEMNENSERYHSPDVRDDAETSKNGKDTEEWTTTGKPASSVKSLVIIIIVVLSLLLLFAIFLIYWFCIRRKAPREDVSTEMEEPPSPEENKAETKSLSSDDLDLSLRSEAE